MKKNLFYYLFAVLCTVTLFASCSDDDDKNPSVTIPVEQEFVGTYKGALSVNVSGIDMGSTNQNVSITKASDNSINLIIADFSFSNLSLGDIKLENCIMQSNGSAYVCQRDEQLTLKDPVGTCAVKTIVTIQNGTVVVDLNITVPALDNQVVKVVYRGTKLKGEESNEAKILSFIFDKENTVNSIVIGDVTINEDNTITFVASDGATDDQLKSLVPTIEISKGATLNAPTTLDFSRDMIYTVISEDGATINTYTVKAPTKIKEPMMKYDFDNWETVTGTTTGLVNTTKYSWDFPSPTDELASANEGIAAMRTFFGGNYKGDYATVKEESGYGAGGNAVKLVTLETRGVGSFSPAITPGSLFTGKFAFSLVIDPNEQLKLTKFGLPYYRKPIKLKGVYKYAVGAPFIDGSDKDNIMETDDVDAPSIRAVLYEAKDNEGNEVTLTGQDINNSPQIVAYAALKDESAKADWTTFEEDFAYVEGKSYDATKEYKLAIICSSSKEGDRFRGAKNSTLIIDNLEVVGE